MPIVFDIPGRFANDVLFERAGAIIKERATGKIVAHVQETGLWALAKHLPIPGGNPLKLLTEGIQIAQLAKIQETLNVVQTLATVGAVASVASLGVSVAGFGLVLARLGRMDRKLDRMMETSRRVRQLAEHLHVKIDAIQLAELRNALESIDLARHFDAQRRQEALRHAITDLAKLRQYYALMLEDPTLTIVGSQDALALLDAHERMTAAAEAELFAEFLLTSDPILVEERWKRQRAMFDQVAWRRAGDLYGMLEEADKANGVYLVTSADERTAVVKAIMAVRNESIERLESFPLLAFEVASRGVTGTDYVNAVDAAKHSAEPVVVLEASTTAGTG